MPISEVFKPTMWLVGSQQGGRYWPHIRMHRALNNN
jgi:hypothetical protein